MENLVASSPIVQPSDTFHTTTSERTEDWEVQIAEGRRLMDIPATSQERIAEGLRLINLLQNPAYDYDEEQNSSELVTIHQNQDDDDETVLYTRDASV